jgi:hypothetical protein
MRRILLLGALLAASEALAHPFTLSQGATDVTLSISVWRIERFFDGNGKDVPLSALGVKVTQTDVMLQVDHGLTDWLTLSFSLPYSRSKLHVLAQDDEGPVNDGASDARLGLKLRLSGEGRTQFSILAGFKWPGDYATDLVYAPGDGNFDAEMLASVAHRFSRFTLSAEAGYRYRNGLPANEVLGRFEPSVLIGSRLTLYGVVSYVDSLDGIGIDETVDIQWPFTRAEEDVLRLTAGSLYSFTPRVALFASWSATVDGRSTAQGPRWTAGTKLFF